MTVGPLTIRVFEGSHLRPDTGKGTRAYGYYVTAKNAPSLAFPADVRDYSAEGLPDLSEADFCFAHVWMGDQSNREDFGDYPQQFADFMLRFSTKNVILAHLYENGRKDHQMWTNAHAQILANAICSISPTTNIRIPKAGDALELK